MQHGRFDGRACLVTGGGRGIGRAIAEALAREGAQVAVAARSETECASVAASIGGLGLPADVTDAGACVWAIGTVVERFGRLDVLVNAAGISPVRQRAESHDIDAFAQIVDVNLTGAYRMTHAAAPALLERGGAVVMVASVLGTTSSPRLAGYGASKAGLVQLTRTLAREWGDRGVRVNALCPGYVETELSRPALASERRRAEILRDTALGRIATMREIVEPALFLASDDARYVTGIALVVDGGMTA